MPHPRSAAKRHRQSLRRRERNQTRRTATRGALRTARETVASGPREEAEEAVRAAVSALDRAASKGVLHRNNAARRKSRLMRSLHTAQTGGADAAPAKRRGRAGAPASRARGRKR